MGSNFYDSYLRGHEGGLQIEINSRGRQVRSRGFAKLSRGKILLTVDQRSANGYESLAGRRVRSSS